MLIDNNGTANATKSFLVKSIVFSNLPSITSLFSFYRYCKKIFLNLIFLFRIIYQKVLSNRVETFCGLNYNFSLFLFFRRSYLLSSSLPLCFSYLFFFLLFSFFCFVTWRNVENFLLQLDRNISRLNLERVALNF